MKLSEISEESKYYLNILTAQVSSPFAIDITQHGKAIRDILDNVEGHLYRCYNSSGRYDHASLKYDAPHMSKSALELRESTTKGEFNGATHREHAKPMKILLEEMQGLSGQRLLDYLMLNLKSVTILNKEAERLDEKFKITMPDKTDIFSRFNELGITVVCRKPHIY